MEYVPDKWLGVKISKDESQSYYKIFACWYGGYLNGDSWKLNSGVIKATLDGCIYSFFGSSGSIYLCHENNYGASGYGSRVLSSMIDEAAKSGVTIEILPEEIDWLGLNYNP